MFGTSLILAHASPPASLVRQRGRISAICQGLPDARVGGGGVTHAASGAAFAELAIGGSQYLAGCGKGYRGTLSAGRPADVITGVCLFGADAVTGIAGGRRYPLTAPETGGRDGGRPFSGIDVDDRVHVSEAEAAARLGSFIADLAGQLAPAPVRVHAHIPVPEYILRGLDLYVRGYLTRADCDRYARAVRRRGLLVTRLLQAAVGGASEVRACSPMSWLSEADAYQVPRAGLPQLLHAAACRQGGLWQVLAGAEPGPLRDLGNASYVHHYLSAAWRSQRLGSQLAVVEDPDEEPIWRRAAALQRRTGIQMDRAAAFYVHPRVVVRAAAFGLPPLLYNCKDGCSPRTVRAAMPASPRAAVAAAACAEDH